MARSRASWQRSSRRVALLGALWVAAATTPAAHADEAVRVLDAMQEPLAWVAAGSDGVATRLEPLSTESGPALRLQFDFHGGAGYATAARALSLDLPENFEMTIALRGSVADNDVELKLVDSSGDNVWWYRQAHGRISQDWQTLRIRRRQIVFAWGPTADRQLRHTERLEVVVNAGRGASHGALEIGAITLQALPLPPPSWPAPQARNGAGTTGSTPGAAVDGDEESAWHCARGRHPCVLEIDYGLAREFGGLKLVWIADHRASRYEIALSNDGSEWQTTRRVAHGAGLVDWLWLGEREARFVRIRLEEGPDADFALAEACLLDVSLGTNVNAFVGSVAHARPRGHYPRGYTEQSYWTLVGLDGGSESGLLSEDGALELGRGAPSIEPFVVEADRVFTWADVDTRQRLAAGYLPIPTVEWRATRWSLAVTAVAHRTRAQEGLWARYRVRNRTAKPLHLRLVLAARPFQVNPPAQFLTTPGGVSPIEHVAWDGRLLRLNRRWRVLPLRRPDVARVFDFDSAAIPDGLGVATGDAPEELTDDEHLGSGVLAYDLNLPPEGHADVGLFIAWRGDEAVAAGDAAPAASDFETALASETQTWLHRLNRVTVRAAGSAEGRDVSDTLRTALAHIILSRAGPLLRPGTRAYARSWIRDGAMMSDALLRLGEQQLPKDYLAAYSRFLFADGKVPCCVDERGADPVPEHDSPGEFLHLAAEVLRHTRDEVLVRSVWPKVRAAAGYLERLRQSTRVDANRQGDSTPFFGLLPASISHEGYSAKPMHSYWDDFWGLCGYSDAVFLATRLGHAADAAAMESARLEFAGDVLASLEAASRQHDIKYIPGAAELGDFDATSTTIALAPGIGTVRLPVRLLEGTFEHYWSEFIARRDGTRDWSDYTPYEWRVVGSFVRLGWPERAHAALQFFLDGRRPAAWRQWPEVVDRDPRHARFIGDLPHGWVASDFMRATLDLFAFERESDEAVVLAAGIPAAWLVGEGVDVRRLLTQSGPLSYRLRRHGRRTDLTVLAGSALPPGGFVYREPVGAASRRVRMNGHPVRFERGELHIDRVPAQITVIDP